MTLTVKRNDGFFDYVFNYYFFLNGKKYKLGHSEEIEIDLPEGEYEVYSKYYWMRSKKKKIALTDKNARIDVKLFMERQQWFKLLVVIGLAMLMTILGNDLFHEMGLFILKSWLVFYLFMLTIGSERFMRIVFEEES